MIHVIGIPSLAVERVCAGAGTLRTRVVRAVLRIELPEARAAPAERFGMTVQERKAASAIVPVGRKVPNQRLPEPLKTNLLHDNAARVFGFEV